MLTITVKGADTLAKGFAAAPLLIETQERDAMQRSLLLIEADARRHVRQDTRRLMGSITHTIEDHGTTLTGRVGPSVKYGLFVERGTRPHWPPAAALAPWARRHGIPVFLVQRAIARRGTKARPFMLPAFEQNVRAITALWQKLGGVVVQAIARGGR